MHHRLHLAASALLLILSVQVYAQTTGTPRATPKVSDAIQQSLTQGNFQEVLVEFDDTPIQTRASEMRKLAKVEHDDAETLNYKAGEYVKLKGSAMAGVATTDHDKLSEYSHLPLTFVRLKTPAALSALLADPRVKAIHTNDLKWPVLDSISAGLINQPAVNTRGFTGTGAAVAIIDTGVNYTQADFGCTAPGVPAGCKVSYYANMADTSTVLDSFGHGTNVAGIVTGVAPGANIVALNVFGATASVTDATLITAINWAIANQALYNITAINLSLGDNLLYPTACTNSVFAPVVSSARAVGIKVFAAAGNHGASVGLPTPACVPGVTAVGAIHDTTHAAINFGVCTDTAGGADQTACFTDLPDPLYYTSSGLNYSYVMAPGVNVTAGGYTYSGTSQATPFMAASYAIRSAAIPALSVTQKQQAITYTGIYGDCSAYTSIPISRSGFTAGTSPTLAQFYVNRLDMPTCLAEPNDAFPLTTGLYPTFGSENVFATKEVGEPNHAGNAGGHSVWAVFTPTVSSPVQIDTHVSGFDTLLAVYTGSSVAALTQIAANDDDGTVGGTSSLTFQALAGTTYKIAIDGKNGATGIYLINTKYLGTDLSLTMSAAGVSATSIKYSLQANNAGPGIATNSKVTVTLPAGVTLDPLQAGGCTAGVGNVVTCLAGTLNVGGVANITFFANATLAGNYSTTATISSDLTELNPSNNTATIQTLFNYSDLAISLNVVQLSTTSLRYFVAVNNLGPSAATSTKVTVTLPTGIAFNPLQNGGCSAVGNLVTCLLGTVSLAGTSNAMFDTNVAALGTYTTTALVSATQVDSNLTNNTKTIQTSVQPMQAAAQDNDVPTLPEWGMIILGLLLWGSMMLKSRARIA
jgi:hypothetical protein